MIFKDSRMLETNFSPVQWNTRPVRLRTQRITNVMKFKVFGKQIIFKEVLDSGWVVQVGPDYGSTQNFESLFKLVGCQENLIKPF